MKVFEDKRIVLTLDAGGTNFVFSAMQAGEEIIDAVRLPSNANDLDKCLKTIIDGFSEAKSKLKQQAEAISFAFPGPADYPNGIIGDLGNLPAFRGGVALGPMLKEHFGLPVFINNDGDLFAYGEALAGVLPEINEKLAKAGNPKRYKNLFGVTLGTGFGGGLVRDGELFLGDNSLGSEVWLLRNKLHPKTNAEEGVSIRAAQRVYAQITGISEENAPTPKEIYDIGMGLKEGDVAAAKEAYRQMGEVIGDSLSNILTIIDGIAVIGGGVAGAKELIWPSLISEMRSTFENFKGNKYPRLVQGVFDLNDDADLAAFVKSSGNMVKVPGSDKFVPYEPEPKVAIAMSKLGASKAIAVGAYAFALNKLN